MKKIVSVAILILLVTQCISSLVISVKAESQVTIMPTRLPQGIQIAASIWEGTNAYIFGGASHTAGPFNSILKYNPITGSISSMSAVLPDPVCDFPAVWTGQYVYTFGGYVAHLHTSDKIVRYDPSTDTIAVMGARLPNYAFPLYSMCAIWDGNYAYLFGGYDGYSYYDQILRYDPVNDQITVMNARLPTGTKWMPAVWSGTYAYVFGGRTPYGASDQIVRYDPTHDSTTVMSAKLPVGILVSSAVWAGSCAYVFGGSDINNQMYDSILRYDPTSDSITTVDNLPSLRRFTCAVWNGNSAYIFGGEDSNSHDLDEIVEFSPTTNAGPAGYWKFDEGSGTVASDSSGNGNIGTLYNGPQWVSGVVGNALRFDGSNDYVRIPHSSSLDITGNEISVEFWMKLTNGWHPEPGASYIYDQILYDKGNAYTSAMIKSTGALRFNIPYVPPYPETNKNNWDANTWYHIAEVFDGAQIRIYVNGVLDKAETVIGSVSRSTINLALGSHCFGGAHFFNGAIDEFAIYNYARTAEEIQNDYGSVSPPVGQKPVAILYLDDEIHNIGADVWFYGDQSYDPDGGKIISYIFDFDDQTPNQQVYWPQIGTTHQYSAAGEYYPRMKVIDDEGTESDWVSVTLTILPAPGFPTAILTAYPNPQKVGNCVTFDACQSSDPDGISDYGFDFGDSTPIMWTSNPIVTHSYSQVGEYYARVLVVDNSGLETWSARTKVTIGSEPPSQEPDWTDVLNQAQQRKAIYTLYYEIAFNNQWWNEQAAHSFTDYEPNFYEPLEDSAWDLFFSVLMNAPEMATYVSILGDAYTANKILIELVAWMYNQGISDALWIASQSYNIRSDINSLITAVDSVISASQAQSTGSLSSALNGETAAARKLYQGTATYDSMVLNAVRSHPTMLLIYPIGVRHTIYWIIRGHICGLRAAVEGSYPELTWLQGRQKSISEDISAPIEPRENVPIVSDAYWSSGISCIITAQVGEAVAAHVVVSPNSTAYNPLKVSGKVTLNLLKERPWWWGGSSVWKSKTVDVSLNPGETQEIVLTFTVDEARSWIFDGYYLSATFSGSGPLSDSFFTDKPIRWEDGDYAMANGYPPRLRTIGQGRTSANVVVSQEVQGKLYLHVYDQHNNHVGMNYQTNQVDLGIPAASYYDDRNGMITIGLPMETVNFTVVMDARYAEYSTESYTLRIIEVVNLEILNEQTINSSINQQEKQEYGILSIAGELKTISWEYAFGDPKRGTLLRISTDDKYFQFVASSKDFGIKYDPKMAIYRSLIAICYKDSEILMTAIATTGKIVGCTATLLDRQTCKLYWLFTIQKALFC